MGSLVNDSQNQSHKAETYKCFRNLGLYFTHCEKQMLQNNNRHARKYLTKEKKYKYFYKHAKAAFFEGRAKTNYEPKYDHRHPIFFGLSIQSKSFSNLW